VYYAIYKVLIITVIRNSKKEIKNILKIIITKKGVPILNKIILYNKSVTLFVPLST
jgi:hypothetical protein